MADFFFNTTLGTILLIIGQIFLVVIPLLLALAFLMYADRKIWASVQLRRGPNVVGIYGLLQSFADFAKYIVNVQRRLGPVEHQRRDPLCLRGLVA